MSLPASAAMTGRKMPVAEAGNVDRICTRMSNQMSHMSAISPMRAATGSEIDLTVMSAIVGAPASAGASNRSQ
jgi:hypothetical protein